MTPADGKGNPNRTECYDCKGSKKTADLRYESCKKREECHPAITCRVEKPHHHTLPGFGFRKERELGNHHHAGDSPHDYKEDRGEKDAED